jgi:hypothetical protein
LGFDHVPTATDLQCGQRGAAAERLSIRLTASLADALARIAAINAVRWPSVSR